MLLIGNGCFLVLSIILRVPMVCVFFHSIYNNISTGINCPGVSCEYDTYLILLNMYVQVILFASMVECNSLLCTFSVVYCHFCVSWSALLSLRLACCVVWSGAISSVYHTTGMTHIKIWTQTQISLKSDKEKGHFI